MFSSMKNVFETGKHQIITKPKIGGFVSGNSRKRKKSEDEVTISTKLSCDTKQNQCDFFSFPYLLFANQTKKKQFSEKGDAKTIKTNLKKTQSIPI